MSFPMQVKIDFKSVTFQFDECEVIKLNDPTTISLGGRYYSLECHSEDKARITKLVEQALSNHPQNLSGLLQLMNATTGSSGLSPQDKKLREIIDKHPLVGTVVKLLSPKNEKDLGEEKKAALERVAQHGSALNKSSHFRFLSQALQSDKDVALKAVESNGMLLEYASINLQNDNQVALKAIAETDKAFIFVGQRLLADKAFILDALKMAPSIFKSDLFPSKMKNDEEIVLSVIERNPYVLQYASESMKNSDKIVDKVIEVYGFAITYVNPRFLANKEFVLKAVKTCSVAFRSASETLHNDRDTVMQAVSLNGDVIEYIPDDFTQDKEIILAAIAHSWRAFKFSGHSLKNDPQFIEEAIMANGMVLFALEGDAAENFDVRAAAKKSMLAKLGKLSSTEQKKMLREISEKNRGIAHELELALHGQQIKKTFKIFDFDTKYK